MDVVNPSTKRNSKKPNWTWKSSLEAQNNREGYLQNKLPLKALKLTLCMLISTIADSTGGVTSSCFTSYLLLLTPFRKQDSRPFPFAGSPCPTSLVHEGSHSRCFLFWGRVCYLQHTPCPKGQDQHQETLLFYGRLKNLQKLKETLHTL